MKANVLWVAMAALLLAGAAPADALLLCAKVDKVTGEPKDGSPIKLRSACKAKGDGTPVEVSIGSTDDLVAIAENALAIAEKADQASVDANAQAIGANASDISRNNGNLEVLFEVYTDAIDAKADQASVDANAQAIAANASGISANSAAISTNTGRVQSAADAAAANAGAIADNALALADKADQADVDANTAEIATKANGRGVIAFAFAAPFDQDEHLPSAPWSYNQTGAQNSVRRTREGTYTVYFPGIESTSSESGMGRHVQVTRYGGTGSCIVMGWGGGQVRVQCYDWNGLAKDSAFTVLVVE